MRDPAKGNELPAGRLGRLWAKLPLISLPNERCVQWAGSLLLWSKHGDPKLVVVLLRLADPEKVLPNHEHAHKKRETSNYVALLLPQPPSLPKKK